MDLTWSERVRARGLYPHTGERQERRRWSWLETQPARWHTPDCECPLCEARRSDGPASRVDREAYQMWRSDMSTDSCGVCGIVLVADEEVMAGYCVPCREDGGRPDREEDATDPDSEDWPYLDPADGDYDREEPDDFTFGRG